MQANELSRERLRNLAALQPPEGKVLSIFVNLDPQEFALAPARGTEVRSLLDRAGRLVRDDESLSRDDRMGLKEDLARIERELGSLDAKGAHGLAIFAASRAGLFEVLKLAEPVVHDPVVADRPFVEPLTTLDGGDQWCVLLANRRTARLLCGSRSHLAEVALVEDDVHGQHDQGGWSQARYQRGIEKEVQDHLRHVADVAFATLRRRMPVGLLIGTPHELSGALKEALHPYLRERLAGRLDVDVEHASVDEIQRLAAGRIAAIQREREDAALERLAEGFANGRGVGGLEDVLLALTEQRVETLLVDAGFSAPGGECPADGLLSAEWGVPCPADGTMLEPRDDVVEIAIARALGQSADVLVLQDRPELGPHRHIGAVLRF
jgi:peptide subunit release factor 1 (eRF1)